MSYKIVNFSIDAVGRSVGLSAQGSDGIFVNVLHIKLSGTEHMQIHELEKHAKDQVRKALREAADSI